jgi:hypothetical protein
MGAIDTAALLTLHRPVIQYDSLESYYADWAAVISDRPGNVLKRASGAVIAAAGSQTTNTPTLTLAFLQPEVYPTGESVEQTDFIVETGSDYVSQAREMHARPGYANKVHGRVVAEAGTTWLQYWFFMYYDDPGFLGFGTHEGDIEMIQLRLGDTGVPDAVSYSQHRSGVSAAWTNVELDGPAPVVYSARGTHASMLRSGTLTSDRSFIPDHNDAHGPRIRPDLIALSEGQTPWAFWPGHWGGTKPEHQILGTIGIEANSPFALSAHMAWGDPAGFHAKCDADDLPAPGQPHTLDAPAPPAPKLDVSVDAERHVARISYAIPHAAGAAPASSLVIGVDTSQGALPPATTAIPLHGKTGVLETTLPPGTRSVDVRATTQSSHGAVSDTTTAGS